MIQSTRAHEDEIFTLTEYCQSRELWVFPNVYEAFRTSSQPETTAVWGPRGSKFAGRSRQADPVRWLCGRRPSTFPQRGIIVLPSAAGLRDIRDASGGARILRVCSSAFAVRLAVVLDPAFSHPHRPCSRSSKQSRHRD
ncbi:conserved hypothetical protein [Coccidioides posadasii str. Silveira]|uniref:Uncharacterized protein n=2 Tax=Coccidioides posadasii TaxID=199306 RepID=E9DCC1_COCPS|nr:conserved hypothetical protein [Coccidioides posadasii str. Silveira]KMM69157.1 hypothetical protein CPAG_05479 [Coccidioides posadasii RMSCC 3488]